MKLLFDQNVSPDLVHLLSDLFPDSQHVFVLGLDNSSDLEIWNYANEHGFTIFSKDQDYTTLAAMRGCPPKVLWIRTGNCTTQQLEELVRRDFIVIKQFESDTNRRVLVIY